MLPTAGWAARRSASGTSRLPEALAEIAGLGFGGIDLGALPGVCDHVPYVLDGPQSRTSHTVAAVRPASALDQRRHRRPQRAARRRRRAAPRRPPRHAASPGRRHRRAARWCCRAARSIAPRCARWTTTWTWSPPNSSPPPRRGRRAVSNCGPNRCTSTGCATTSTRAQALTDRLTADPVGIVMDFSHIVASGGDPVDFVDRFAGRIAHVHIRDAVPGNINLSVGNGDVDFAARPQGARRRRIRRPLRTRTRDPRHHQRPTPAAAAAEAAQLISDTDLRRQNMTTP